MPTQTQSPPSQTATSSPSNRLLSIDVLRGFDMLWITGTNHLTTALAAATGWTFLTNIVTPQLQHTQWTGIRFFDLIFPLFLFLSGCTIPLSIGKKVAAGEHKGKLLLRCFTRLLILIVLGIIYQQRWAPDRWPSVLGFIGLSYFITAALVIYTPRKIHLAWIPFSLIAYYICLKFIPVPHFGSGVLKESGNFASYIDSLLIPSKHLFISKHNFDPEGPFMTIAGSAIAMLGVFAGYVLTSDSSPIQRVGKLALLGLACIGVGLLWSFHFPIIKQLWTSSFVLVASGYSFLMLAFFYLIIDVKKLKITQYLLFPLMLFGINSIAIYMLSSLVRFQTISTNIFEPFASLATNSKWELVIIWLGAVLMQIATLYVFYRKKFLLRI